MKGREKNALWTQGVASKFPVFILGWCGHGAEVGKFLLGARSFLLQPLRLCLDILKIAADKK